MIPWQTALHLQKILRYFITTCSQDVCFSHPEYSKTALGLGIGSALSQGEGTIDLIRSNNSWSSLGAFSGRSPIHISTTADFSRSDEITASSDMADAQSLAQKQ